MIYLVIGFILIIFSYLEIIEYKKWFSVFILSLACIFLVLFAALRDGAVVGTDSPAYYFNYIYPFWNTEPAYKFLNILFSKKLEANYNVFLLFLNACSLFLMWKYFKKNSVFLILPLLIFYSDLYLYFNISGIRQAMAISFTSFSLYYAFHKNLKYFLICIILAAMFHVSSLVFVFAYFIPRNTLKFKYIIWLSALFVGAVYIGNILSTRFEYLASKADYYTKYQVQAENIEFLYVIGILKRSIILLLAFMYRKLLFHDQQFVYYFNLYLVGFLIFISTYLISPDFGVRFSVYYTIVDCVLAGYMLFLVKDIRKRIFIVTVFAAVSIYKLFGYMDSEFYTYKSIIQNFL